MHVEWMWMCQRTQCLSMRRRRVCNFNMILLETPVHPHMESRYKEKWRATSHVTSQLAVDHLSGVSDHLQDRCREGCEAKISSDPTERISCCSHVVQWDRSIDWFDIKRAPTEALSIFINGGCQHFQRMFHWDVNVALACMLTPVITGSSTTPTSL